jgi:WD40 repeat protein
MLIIYRFLDNRLHASCSDDMKIKLWDLRQLKSEVRTFNGHTSWVKNVEFASNKGWLMSSAFDHNVFAWDINE